jgi:hypothetical protein
MVVIFEISVTELYVRIATNNKTLYPNMCQSLKLETGLYIVSLYSIYRNIMSAVVLLTKVR